MGDGMKYVFINAIIGIFAFIGVICTVAAILVICEVSLE
jgi:uncharacterized membrane protein